MDRNHVTIGLPLPPSDREHYLPLTRTEYWRLTIHYFPAAAKAGLCPVPYMWMGWGEDQPQFYQPRDIEFTYAPKREDFLAVVASVPWMRTSWEKELLPLIAANQWPLVCEGHKSESVDLKLDGKTVARLDVCREYRYENRPYYLPILQTYPGGDVAQFIARHVKGEERRADATKYVEDYRNRIYERLINLNATPSNSQLMQEVGRMLAQGNFCKAPRGVLQGQTVAAITRHIASRRQRAGAVSATQPRGTIATTLLSEHDVVRVIEDVESDGYAVKKGMTGAIVSVYNSGEAYAVEISEIDDGPAVVTLQAGEVALVPGPADAT